jgi:hypothetical protein
VSDLSYFPKCHFRHVTETSSYRRAGRRYMADSGLRDSKPVDRHINQL